MQTIFMVVVRSTFYTVVSRGRKLQRFLGAPAQSEKQRCQGYERTARGGASELPFLETRGTIVELAACRMNPYAAIQNTLDQAGIGKESRAQETRRFLSFFLPGEAGKREREKGSMESPRLVIERPREPGKRRTWEARSRVCASRHGSVGAKKYNATQQQLRPDQTRLSVCVFAGTLCWGGKDEHKTQNRGGRSQDT